MKRETDGRQWSGDGKREIEWTCSWVSVDLWICEQHQCIRGCRVGATCNYIYYSSCQPLWFKCLWWFFKIHGCLAWGND